MSATRTAIGVRVPAPGEVAALVTIQRARLHLLAHERSCCYCSFPSSAYASGDRLAILLLSFMEAVQGGER